MTRCHWIVKHAAGMCGVGKMMAIWKEWPTPDCPRCGEFEDALHVWQCQEHSVQGVWEQAIARLRTWLDWQKTQPGIHDAICNFLTAWHSNQPSPPITSAFLEGVMHSPQLVGGLC